MGKTRLDRVKSVSNLFRIFAPRKYNKLMMTTVTNQNMGTPSRLSRLQDAKEYMVQHGWTPLTPEEEVEFHKMVAEFTNL